MKNELTAEEQHLRNLELLKKLRPIDDDFMREMFRGNIPLVQLVLRIITGIDDLTVTSEETQYDLEHLLGAKSICLDVLAKDNKGRIYNLEIQRANNGASPHRARYHSSAIDIEFLKKNQNFDKLPVTYVIFITENDIQKKNKPIYIFERRDTDTNESFGDDEYIIYVNGAYNNPDDHSDLAKLINDFTCSDHNDMNIKLMADATRYYKEEPKGVSHMCKLMEDMANERAEEAVKNEKNKLALNLISLGTLSKEDIAKATELSLDEIETLAKQPVPALA